MTQRHQRILVADDTRFFRVALASLLRAQGWEVLEAGDGPSALERTLAEAGALDLVLLDLQMPGMDGFEVLQRIRQDPQARSVPVLAMTATGANADPGDAMQAVGATGFIDKSVALAEVVERVRGILEPRRTGPG